MEKDKLKELIIEHKERFLTKKDLIKRKIQANINSYLKHREIIVITGIRRGGKSSLMKLIADDLVEEFNVPVSNILYLNFEDERFIEFEVKDFNQLHEIFLEIYNPKGRKYFFLDEIQNIVGWERWVNRLYEFEDIKIFVTGSNSTILSSEISTALTGRNRQLTNWPFSFREFLSLKNYSIDEKDFYLRERRVEIKNLFKEYLRLGGFPEVLKIDDITLLEQYFKDILYRDVVARYSIRNIKEIKELSLFLSSNIGTIQSCKNLRDLIGVKSVNTVKNYLEILENVFLFFRLNLFDYSIKRQIYNPSKIYSIDPALSNSIAFKFSRNIGHIYENLVFVELKRRDKDIFYWKSKSGEKGEEVDYVIKRGMQIEEAIQVSFNLSSPKTKEREVKSLVLAKSELGVNYLTIITEDEEGEEKSGQARIRIIPLWKWLLLP
ncbi:MAG: ATP-binding protein [bacterium]|nr:ATP-binding protein [bacterium]